jgi:hypothetical protein
MNARPIIDHGAAFAAMCAEAGVDPWSIPNAPARGVVRNSGPSFTRFRRIRPQRSPDRQRSIERRRCLAASGVMPPRIAAQFTTGELAVLRIVADEAKRGGTCDLPLGALTARAGVSRTTAQNALRAAARAFLLTVRERRRRGANSLTNIVRIISPEWLAWIARGPRSRPPGFKMLNTTDREVRKRLGDERVRAREVPSHCTAPPAAGRRGANERT